MYIEEPGTESGVAKISESVGGKELGFDEWPASDADDESVAHEDCAVRDELRLTVEQKAGGPDRDGG